MGGIRLVLVVGRGRITPFMDRTLMLYNEHEYEYTHEAANMRPDFAVRCINPASGAPHARLMIFTKVTLSSRAGPSWLSGAY